MSQIMEADAHADEEEWDMEAARAKLRPKVDQSKKGRQGRQKKIAQSVSPSARDGRSLRATGRTEHLNFKSRPDIKGLLQEHVGRGHMSLWLEEAIIAKLKSEGVEVPDA
jgi:hypothetical protein